MTFVFVVGFVLIAGGIVTIVFPDFTRKADRFTTSMRGQQPHQGEAYEAGRVLRGVGLILAGIAVMRLLAWI